MNACTPSGAAELAGVSSTKLRKWEQRYGVVVPQRSEGNYRLYDDEAVRRLSVMRTLVDSGWSARQAAQHVVNDVSAAEAEIQRPEEPCTDARSHELVQCAMDFDVPRLERLLSDAFADGDYVTAIDGWLLPPLVHVGKAWQRGDVSVAGEHFVCAAVHRLLAHAFQSLPMAEAGGPRVVAGLARGSRYGAVRLVEPAAG